VICSKVDLLDSLGVVKWLEKSAWFWCKMAVGSSFLSPGFGYSCFTIPPASMASSPSLHSPEPASL